MNISYKLISEYNQTNQTYRLVICVYNLLCVKGNTKDLLYLRPMFKAMITNIYYLSCKKQAFQIGYF